ncbi:lymphocyte-specific protein 1 isoform X6 [Pygocentrus nattereri]|uniref:lymphocyte-specific protein 1 isoform X6 n=1 Tax=Pygocentrus nattereri TaxID=42514 RepID=UPI000814AB9F|nr:lymphocyte-specific protein 1 isoform X6 [Pygocentrus nattereri]
MSILRRHSSRQGLQDLQRITVQRSLEDAEEIEREQRRRERASSSTAPPQDTCSPVLCEDSLCKSDLKPSWLSSWEGDDGFSSCLEQVERQTEKCETTEVREQRKEMKISYTSKLHLQKDLRCETTTGVEEAIRKAPCLGEENTEAGSEMNEGPQKREGEEQTHHEEKNEEEKVQEETEVERLKQMREEEKEKKRRSVMEKIKRLSVSSTETDEPFSPLSPTLMVEEAQGLTEEFMCSISERTESLNRSVKKSNSFQKTPPPSMITLKIDSRLEQYNHAIEASSQEVRDAKAGLFDFPSSPEPVSARKNKFEVGDAGNQNSAKASSKDTEGLKVGVADLITQWVKGNPDVNSKTTPSKPTSNEVKAGEVHQKKSLWETKDTFKAEYPGGKASMDKKFKFVWTSHGKYEKVLADDSVSHTNVKSSQ